MNVANTICLKPIKDQNIIN